MKKELLVLFLTLPVATKARITNLQTLFDELEESFNQSITQLHESINNSAHPLNRSARHTKDQCTTAFVDIFHPSFAIQTRIENDLFIVEANVAGFQKGEVKAEIEEKENKIKLLTILAESKEETKEEKNSETRTSKRSSFSHKKLQKSIILPQNVDPSSHTVAHEDGVFKISFKLTEEPQTKKITISIDSEE